MDILLHLCVYFNRSVVVLRKEVKIVWVLSGGMCIFGVVETNKESEM